MSRPSFQFYPKEWIWDLELRQCSAAARGLWADLMCLMHEGEPYGHLTAPLDLILRITGLTEEVYTALLAELETERASGKRVAYRTEEGAIYSRRMVRDEARRGVLAANGKHGGRPAKVLTGGGTRNCFPVVHPNTEADWDAEISFEALWEAYPAKGRVRKPMSQQYFCDKIRSRAAFEVALAAVKGKFAQSEKWAKGFIMALPEWINQECWNEDPDPAGGQEPGATIYKKWEPGQP
jgi:hypothetical protein